ncbi:MAG: hypothetical protein LLG42_04800 [Chloroflexi bacterium]|nr:hypothetical protein [Chloroflexota bacterium]
MLQRTSQEIRPLTTAHLAQTMTLLQMTIDEIKQEIESELSSNPALELRDERRCPTCGRLLQERENCPVCSIPKESNPEDPVVFISPKDDFTPHSDQQEDDYLDGHDYSPITEDLPTYVLKQILPDLAEEDRQYAVFLLANLDDDGFLTVDPLELAQYFHVPLAKINGIRRIIQKADPLGVGSLNPREALQIQIEILSETQAVPALATLIVNEAMDLLSKRQFNEIAHRYNCSVADVHLAVSFISENLNPFPGRSYWGDVRSPSVSTTQVYHRPDIIINYLNDDPAQPLIVEIIMPLGGTLRVNPLFRKAVKSADEEQKDIWKEDLERASLFVKCLQQRNHTMQRLMFHLVKLQRDFIVKGPKYIEPITRVQLSVELDVHESTISRAVANKTVQLPTKQIIPLASFFDRSLNIRTIMREIISSETRPLSDAKLVKLLEARGHFVARRTVAKYRAMEGILPAHLRRMIT